MPRIFPRLAIVGLVALGAARPARADNPASIPPWGRWEGTFEAIVEASPRTELVVTLTTPSGQERELPGFWDGGSTWRVRVMPDAEGTWRYRTRSIPPIDGLVGRDGAFTCRAVGGEPTDRFLRHGAIGVSADGHNLEHADGTPFFWMGDTVWSGPALSTPDDWATYLDRRADQRYSVIQYNAVCPWRAAPTDREGRTAFLGSEDIAIVPEYFQELDRDIDAINARGLLAAPILIWANQPADPGNALPEDDLIRLARYQVARYGAHHVAWILGGDNAYKGDNADRWKRVGRAVFGERPAGARAPVTTHPTGMNWPWDDWRDEAWLTVLGYQSGHGDDAKTLGWIHSGPVRQYADADPRPARPIINLEPPYEDHEAYQSHRPHDAHSVRRAAYWSLLNAPPAGLTYGAHGLWSWEAQTGGVPPGHARTGAAKAWHEALDLPGGDDMTHVVDLFTSLPWWRLRPADAMLDGQPGGDDPARHVSAARTVEGDAALVYLPEGGEVALRPDAIPAGAAASWFDPRDGRRSPARPEGGRFRTPDDRDWVLVLRRDARP